jgi:hypothetical protein
MVASILVLILFSEGVIFNDLYVLIKSIGFLGVLIWARVTGFYRFKEEKI